ncbi:helix-turn-helix transcriptional regulator [Anaerolineales bacterium HSG25]|nr:helix-turn-helix transcriptional regulator [Anaerolineales bacterium HSG25]
MDRFGEKLRGLRQEQGLSLRKLAEILEIKSFSHLAKIERGELQPSARLVLRVAKFFEVSADPLMDDELELE